MQHLARPPTYSVFVGFRKGRLALRRRLPSLREAVACAESLRATRRHDADAIFLVCDATDERIELAGAARWVEHSKEALATWERDGERRDDLVRRARRAYEHAIVALERARTVFDRTELRFLDARGIDCQLLEERYRSSVERMVRSIEMLETKPTRSRRPASPGDQQPAGA